MLKKIFNLLILLVSSHILSQNMEIKIPNYVRMDIDEPTRERFLSSLELIINGTDVNKSSTLISSNNRLVTLDLFEKLKSLKNQDSNMKGDIINFYSVAPNTYNFQMLFYIVTPSSESIVTSISNIDVEIKDELKIYFSSPITRNLEKWKTKVIGDTKYYYQGIFSDSIALEFDKNNLKVSSNLGLVKEKFEFVKCKNYQDLLRLIGLDYYINENGENQSSTILGNMILTGLNSEDFSHDILHFYSSKLFSKSERNWITEEGLAYSWGNAYYKDKLGNIITRTTLISHLKNYLELNKEIDTWILFNENPKLFKEVSDRVSVRSTISSVFCDEVEDKLGYESVKELIKCGKGIEPYMKKLNDLISVNKDNFDSKFRAFIQNY